MIEYGFGFVSFEPPDIINQDGQKDGEEPKDPSGQKLGENNGPYLWQHGQILRDLPLVQQSEDLSGCRGQNHDKDESEVEEKASRPPNGRRRSQILPTDVIG